MLFQQATATDHEAASIPDSSVRLADFSTCPRVLMLSVMAAVVGAISSVVAYVLLWLIAAITNLAFHQRWSSEAAIPQGHHLGLWVVAVPVVGALIIGLMAGLAPRKSAGTAFRRHSKRFFSDEAASS